MDIQQTDPITCFDRLRDESSCLLIDCRSAIEVELTGTADISSLNKKSLFIEWTNQQNQKNPDFLEQVKTYASLDTPIIMMCRIGGRSHAACELLAEHGFTNLTNMTEGFEGRADEKGHRNSFEGWRARGLPWCQS